MVDPEAESPPEARDSPGRTGARAVARPLAVLFVGYLVWGALASALAGQPAPTPVAATAAGHADVHATRCDPRLAWDDAAIPGERDCADGGVPPAVDGSVDAEIASVETVVAAAPEDDACEPSTPAPAATPPPVASSTQSWHPIGCPALVGVATCWTTGSVASVEELTNGRELEGSLCILLHGGDAVPVALPNVSVSRDLYVLRTAEPSTDAELCQRPRPVAGYPLACTTAARPPAGRVVAGPDLDLTNVRARSIFVRGAWGRLGLDTPTSRRSI